MSLLPRFPGRLFSRRRHVKLPTRAVRPDEGAFVAGRVQKNTSPNAVKSRRVGPAAAKPLRPTEGSLHTEKSHDFCYRKQLHSSCHNPSRRCPSLCPLCPPKSFAATLPHSNMCNPPNDSSKRGQNHRVSKLSEQEPCQSVVAGSQSVQHAAFHDESKTTAPRTLLENQRTAFQPAHPVATL